MQFIDMIRIRPNNGNEAAFRVLSTTTPKNCLKKQFFRHDFQLRKESKTMANDKVLHVTDDEFDNKVVGNSLPCLVDFWAPWCGPCKAIGPVIEELAEEFDGKVQIAKMNVDDNPATPGKFGIRAIPTLILFKDGEVVDKITGAVGKAQLNELINKAL